MERGSQTTVPAGSRHAARDAPPERAGAEEQASDGAHRPAAEEQARKARGEGLGDEELGHPFAPSGGAEARRYGARRPGRRGHRRPLQGSAAASATRVRSSPWRTHPTRRWSPPAPSGLDRSGTTTTSSAAGRRSSPSRRRSRSSTIQGTPLVFCQEKLFKIKDDIRIYADSSKKVELLRIKQRNIMDWAGLFDVFDPATSAKIGAFRRKGWRSWVRDEWHLLDTDDQQVGTHPRDGQRLPAAHLQVPAVHVRLRGGRPAGGHVHPALRVHRLQGHDGHPRLAARCRSIAAGVRRRAAADGGRGEGRREPLIALSCASAPRPSVSSPM